MGRVYKPERPYTVYTEPDIHYWSPGEEECGEYSQQDYELAKKYADTLEHYLNEINVTFILTGISRKKEKEAIKTVRKLIKKLRNGQLNKVYDPVAYREYRNLSDSEY